MKKVHRWVAVLGITVLAGAAWWWQNRPAPLGTGQPATSASGANPAAAQRAAAGGPGGPAGPAGQGGPVSVEVGKVEAAMLEDDATAVGSLRSRQGVVLRPEVSGRIASLGFNDGQRVRRGQLLVQLDDTLQRAQLKQAEAQASIARTNLQRNRELVSENFVSQSAVDQSAAALEVAEAQVALTQAQLARMRIVAPFDGMAGIRSVDLGDYVKDGADLVNIEDLSQVLVDFRLPERFIARVKTGQTVDVSLDALPGQRFTGRIDALDSVIDADGRSLLVRARLDNPGGVLKSGLFARTRIVFSKRENALLVPEEALVPQGGKQYLFKVVDGPNGKVARRIEASIGMRLPGKVEVLEGLAAGDLVVTAGQARLGRGDAVPLRVVDLTNPAGGAAGRPPGNGSRPAGGASAPRPPSP
ncbi:MAG: efflux RND transporter periplasmic adaptor subunit [Burkholderiaceae bacterium]|nr:efflux RND transporter periplasmic adaptor subunit [Burkholderiaceae bacterium]MCU0965037.1 efflux RND transporter periplasmic adaptor subunit [Burkholderiaceae bacterium]